MLSAIENRNPISCRRVAQRCGTRSEPSSVIAYLLWASQTWVVPQERGMGTTTPGDALVWGAFVLPLFGAFLIVNLVWGSLIVFQRRWQTGRLWLTAFVVWMGAIVVDVTRHY